MNFRFLLSQDTYCTSLKDPSLYPYETLSFPLLLSMVSINLHQVHLPTSHTLSLFTPQYYPPSKISVLIHHRTYGSLFYYKIDRLTKTLPYRAVLPVPVSNNQFQYLR